MALITTNNLTKSYGATDIFAGITISIEKGSRLGIVGPNGVGKTTLLRILAGEDEASTGTVTRTRGVRSGYLSQEADFKMTGTLWDACYSVFDELIRQQKELHRLEDLMATDPDVLEEYGKLQEEFERRGGYTYDTRIKQVLTGLGFSAEDYTLSLDHLSGGQRTRAHLARLLLTNPDLLLLDEPTNHLDLEMRHALTMALQDYEGAMVLVSHDRALLRATCDRFVLVDGGRIQPFDGDLDDYRDWLATRRAEVAAAAACPDQAADKAARKADRAQAAADRQARLAARRPLVKEVEQIDKRLAAWNKEKAEIDARLADPALYSGPQAGEVPALNKRQAELAERIEEAELRWLELHEALEAIPAD